MLALGPLDAVGVEHVLAARFPRNVATLIGTAVLEVSGGHAGTLSTILQHLEAGAGISVPVSYWSAADERRLTAVLQDGARESIAWRLANMDRADRAVLESAAVVGLSFSADDVAITLGRNRVAVSERLERLAEWGVIRRAAGADTSYRFWHPLHAELVARGAEGIDLLRAARNHFRRRHGQSETA